MAAAESVGINLPARMSEEAICDSLLTVGAVDIRDVDGGAEPFLYSSGNWGPGYIDVKGTVGARPTFKTLTSQVALRLMDDGIEFDNIAGNATGGMIPAYECRERYQDYTGREVGYVYIRGSRKEGGHKELVTGLQHIPPTRPDGSPAHWLVMEELVNYAQTTTNSLLLLRDLGFVANEAATVLYYDHPPSRAKLEEANTHLTFLTTLSNLLDAAVELSYIPEELVGKYREFRDDPPKWMADRGLERVVQ